MRVEIGTVFPESNLAIGVKTLETWHILGLRYYPYGNLSQGSYQRCVYGLVHKNDQPKPKIGNKMTASKTAVFLLLLCHLFLTNRNPGL